VAHPFDGPGFPPLVAAIERARNNLEIVPPRTELHIRHEFSLHDEGEMPDEFDAHVLDVALILQADHELNASTFTARVVAGTLADMYSAVTAALGALSARCMAARTRRS
jgi:citrate synthase